MLDFGNLPFGLGREKRFFLNGRQRRRLNDLRAAQLGGTRMGRRGRRSVVALAALIMTLLIMSLRLRMLLLTAAATATRGLLAALALRLPPLLAAGITMLALGRLGQGSAMMRMLRAMSWRGRGSGRHGRSGRTLRSLG